MTFTKYLENLKVEDGSVAVIWMGQAGFAFKTAKGSLIGIRPISYRLCRKSHTGRGSCV